MKWLTALVLVAVLASVSAVSFFSVVLEEWDAFKLEHGKKYKSAVEESFRLKIFTENKHHIAAHNKLFAQGLKSYSLKMNRFGDMLNSEFISTMNGFEMSGLVFGQRYNGSFYIEADNIAMPETVDWREKGAVTEVKNQEECGSCWAFSATGSLEGQHFRKTGKLVSLSEQNLIDCSARYGNNGCDGGLMDFAFQYIEENGGIDTEESYPYEQRNNTCRYNPRKSGATVTGYVDLPQRDEEALKKAVATVGPISVGIDAASHSFQFYHTGVYYEPTCSSDRLNHGVLAVGYGTENGTDYWLVKNSWGLPWGDKGYIKMLRNYHNHCGIATIASYPLV
ncbi:cathepsin L-like peptidase [Procambarus clarkii]|uniref:cathepsin L-like peptidase n=1 Tax=Procambarus clarkii TaxID=6728 RepID=UPI001E673E90|nr:procathepsin L-like [Procambarus clarkii]WOC30414.1 cathepsin L2 [Procambarus clarkii]